MSPIPWIVWRVVALCGVAMAFPAVAGSPASAASISVSEALPSSPGFHIVRAKLRVPGGKETDFVVGLYLPATYFDSKDRFPVVVTLHNRDRGGVDADKKRFAGEGLASLLDKGAFDPRPPRRNKPGFEPKVIGRFIGLAPQGPLGASEDKAMVAALDGLLTFVVAQYRADADRVYLTGFSYGGNATWRVAMALPGRFAAIAPISFDTPETDQITRSLLRTPIWITTGDKDKMLKACVATASALKAAGHPNLKLQVVPGGDHWCYGTTYEDPAFWSWLLSQSRRPTTTRPAHSREAGGP